LNACSIKRSFKTAQDFMRSGEKKANKLLRLVAVWGKIKERRRWADLAGFPASPHLTS
jgi:hypothetical protein